jgi:predicted transcriptional regulator
MIYKSNVSTMEPIGNICYAYPMDTSTGKKVMEGRMTSICCRIDATMTEKH